MKRKGKIKPNNTERRRKNKNNKQAIAFNLFDI